MPEHEQHEEMSQDHVDKLCRAASAAYYEIIRHHAFRTGEPALIPTLLCPKGCPPGTHEFDEDVLLEAEAFLVRLGVIGIE